MLIDYIPVYFPETNQWSIPGCQIEKCRDYDPEPQDMPLHGGAVIRGIPLFHLGTWGIFGVSVAECLRDLAADPDEAAKRLYRSVRTAAKVSAFFRKLVDRYPDIAQASAFPGHEGLRVPECCIVKLSPNCNATGATHEALRN